MTEPILRTIAAAEVRGAAPTPIDPETRRAAAEIVERVRRDGEPALRQYMERFDGRDAGAPLVLPREEIEGALEEIDGATRACLARVNDRIGAFAREQVRALQTITTPVPGGRAGHTVAPVASAGCYAPGGRYPLPSSVLMTAATAKAAGTRRVVVATPAAEPVVLAAAAIAGADEVLVAGGAHAVAALAYGAGDALRRVDLIVGPGNKWVTAAKQIVFGDVGIDLPAGPSELVVVADDSATPSLVAADLIAQAEHDPDARAVLVALDGSIVRRVDRELAAQLQDLPTAAVARRALRSGFAVVAAGEAEAARAVDDLAPEHLQLSIRDPRAFAARLAHYGAAFFGERSAEVFGDYGAGPNHVLPTGGAARFSGGLSALNFLRVRTWLELDETVELADDCATLAGLERLAGHERAARLRARG